MSVEIRAVRADEFAGWNRAVNVGFLRPPGVSAHDVANRLAHTDLARTQGAFDGERCVAAFRSFGHELVVPGGASVDSSAVTNVGVAPTHRRRGLLSRMMAADLAAAKERGDVLSTLIAAEYPIYGRYGFGPATWGTEWEIGVPRTGLDRRRPGPEEKGARVDLVDAPELREIGPELFERFRTRQPGAVSRDRRWWELSTGLVRLDAHAPWVEPFQAVYRDPSGRVQGLAVYRSDGKWGDGKQPANTLTVEQLIAATPAAERALWHFLCSVDWVEKVRTGLRAPDDLLPQLLPDPRAARVVTHADWLWVRVLDVVRALEARTYAAEGTLVLDVADDAGFAHGRFRLTVGADGRGACEPTSDDADLRLDVAELGALYLGGGSVTRLVALGRVQESGADGTGRGPAALADALLRTARQPWCPDVF
ncbi:GNAT family N-acetyltransferase [Streptomyces sp. NPDC060194]|uniref:GNAT family N-acetyltransferase n=1 Tax=Streptomyces sp. NPDC060194 TaxID=3347069 RepID=UPI00365EC9A0